MSYFFLLIITSLTIKLIFLNRNRTSHNCQRDGVKTHTNRLHLFHKYSLVISILLIEIIKSVSDNQDAICA